MQRPLHTDAMVHNRPYRAMTVTFVAAIHAVAIYGLIAALVPQARIPLPRGPIEVVNTKEKQTERDHAPRLSLVAPNGPTVERPVIVIDNTPRQGPISTAGPTSGYTNVHPEGNVPPRAIAGTHTTPPYPITSLRLGEQGTVRLLLMIGDDGTVISATIEKTSGSYVLDQAAIDWVRKHWRYHPGVENGVAAAMTTEADIRFDLRNAR